MLPDHEDFIGDKMGCKVFYMTAGNLDPTLPPGKEWEQLPPSRKDGYKLVGLSLYGKAKSIKQVLKRGL